MRYYMKSPIFGRKDSLQISLGSMLWISVWIGFATYFNYIGSGIFVPVEPSLAEEIGCPGENLEIGKSYGSPFQFVFCKRVGLIGDEQKPIDEQDVYLDTMIRIYDGDDGNLDFPTYREILYPEAWEQGPVNWNNVILDIGFWILLLVCGLIVVRCHYLKR